MTDDRQKQQTDIYATKIIRKHWYYFNSASLESISGRLTDELFERPWTKSVVEIIIHCCVYVDAAAVAAGFAQRSRR